MDIILDIFGNLVINHSFNIFDIDTSGCNFCGYQYLPLIFEWVHDCGSFKLIFVSMQNQYLYAKVCF